VDKSNLAAGEDYRVGHLVPGRLLGMASLSCARINTDMRRVLSQRAHTRAAP
jgi:hypothetical protein